MKPFSEGKTKDLEYCVSSEEEKPDIIVIHIVSNDAGFWYLPHNTVESIGKDKINIGQGRGERGVSKVLLLPY